MRDFPLKNTWLAPLGLLAAPFVWAFQWLTEPVRGLFWFWIGCALGLLLLAVSQ